MGAQIQPPCTHLRCALGNHLLQSHIALCRERAKPLPSTMKQDMICCATNPKPTHIMPSSCTPKQYQGEQREESHPAAQCSQQGREEIGETPPYLQVRARDLLQQISLGCEVLKQHLQHVETREERESCCYLMGTISGMWHCCSMLVHPQLQGGLNLPFSAPIFVVFKTAVKGQHLLHFEICSERLFLVSELL